jgi:beta-lactam-binding protein with PASTA domain
MLSKLPDFLKSRIFFTQLLIAVVTVPDIHGLKLDKPEKLHSDRSLQYKVVDSLYETGMVPGTIMDQDPDANSKVKKGRTVYIAINSVQPPKVKMPNLVDVSYKLAEAILQTFGLKVGRLIYRPDLAKNAVLDQYYKNAPIKAGSDIFKGSEIDLVLGDGKGNNRITVPSLSGLTRGESVFVLKGASLNLGKVTYDAGVSDSANAKIYRQSPAGGDEGASKGDGVDIFLH